MIRAKQVRNTIMGTANYTDQSGAQPDLLSTCSGPCCGALPQASASLPYVGGRPKVPRANFQGADISSWQTWVKDIYPSSLGWSNSEVCFTQFPKGHQQDWAPVFPNGNLFDNPTSHQLLPLPCLTFYSLPAFLESPLNLLVSIFWGNPNKILTFTEKVLRIHKHAKGFIEWLSSYPSAHAFRCPLLTSLLPDF